MSALLIVPLGPPGCGKSTLATDLVSCGMSEDAIIEPDRFRTLMTGDRAEQSANGRVFTVCDTIADTRLQYGLDVYYDATNFQSLQKFVAFAHDRRANLVFVRFDPDWETLERRNRSREHTVPSDVLARMFADYTTACSTNLPATTLGPEPMLALAREGRLF